MSRFFRGVNDLTDLPIIGAEEYEASVEFGWVDILTAWSASADHQVRENAIASLVHLAEQKQPPRQDWCRRKRKKFATNKSTSCRLGSLTCSSKCVYFRAEKCLQ